MTSTPRASRLEGCTPPRTPTGGASLADRRARGAAPLVPRVVGAMAVVAAVLLAGVAPVAAQLLSPGKLATPHAELEGMAKCTQCHVLGSQVQPERCLACHEALAARVQAKAGFHKDKATRCMECHADHLGRDYEMVRWERDAFDHTEADYPLEGKHAQVKCQQCHRTASYLGLSTACSSCHQDEHRGQLGDDCSRCHTPVAWKPARFEHTAARFALRGQHATVKCEACHQREAAPAVLDTARVDGSPDTEGFVRYRGLPFAACADCHDDTHRGQLAASHPWRGAAAPAAQGTAATAAAIPVATIPAGRGTACADCHSETGWRPVRFDHDTARFRLSGRHARLECVACHPRQPVAAADSLQRFRPLAFARCADCHSDFHRGQFAGRDCAACHADTGWKPARLDHDSTRYPLRGRHAQVTCGKCHRQETLAAGGTGRRYRPVEFGDCAACHADPHAGQFTGRPCASCHTVVGWKAPAEFDHDRARFPLRGAHAKVTCDQCHGGAVEGEPARFRPLPFARCTDCHRDAHDGQFGTASGLRDCAECHQVAAWKPAAAFRHDRARYRLNGAHVKVECAACHPVYTTAAGDERRRYRPLAMECAACHR